MTPVAAQAESRQLAQRIKTEQTETSAEQQTARDLLHQQRRHPVCGPHHRTGQQHAEKTQTAQAGDERFRHHLRGQRRRGTAELQGAQHGQRIGGRDQRSEHETVDELDLDAELGKHPARGVRDDGDGDQRRQQGEQRRRGKDARLAVHAQLQRSSEKQQTQGRIDLRFAGRDAGEETAQVCRRRRPQQTDE